MDRLIVAFNGRDESGRPDRAALPAVLTGLVEALDGPDDDLSGAAASVLSAIGRAGRLTDAGNVVPALVAALGRRELQSRAYDALASIGKAALPALIQALSNPDRTIRLGAALALRGIGVEARDAVPALMASLREDAEDPLETTVAEFAAQALGNIGDDAVPALMAALADDDRRVRRGAARALGHMDPAMARSAVAALADATQDEDSRVRRASASALRHIGPDARAAVPVLTSRLADSDQWVRFSAIGALARIGDDGPAVASALVSALRDPNEFVRREAAGALGELRSGQAVPALVDVLRGADDALGAFVVSALGAIGARPDLTIPALVEAIRTGGPQTRNRAVHVIGRAGPAALTRVIALLEDPHSIVRRMAADALAYASEQPKDAVTALVIALRDRDPAVRSAVAHALGAIKIAHAAAVPRLVAALEDTDYGVRVSAANALREIGPGARDAIPALIASLDKVQSAAVSTLTAIGEAAIPALVIALGHPDNRDIRLGAADALGIMRQRLDGPDTTRAFAALVAMLDDQDRRLQLYAAVALRNMGNEAQEHVPARWRDLVSRAFIDRSGGC